MNNYLKYMEQLILLYGKDHARVVLGWLYAKVTSKKYIPLEWDLSLEEDVCMEKWINKIVHDNYPLQYILETLPFGKVTINVQEPVLIPRPETEEWVYKVLESLKHYKNEKLHILDMCTGSGCIAIACADYFKHADVDAVDLYQKPLELTQRNAQKNGCTNISVIQSNLFSNLQGKTYDLIFSNPPYIDETVWRTLSSTVKNWEDKNALVAANKGLILYEKMIPLLPQFLRQDSIIQNTSRIYLEIGYDQGGSVSLLLKNAGFENVVVQKDFADHDRMVSSY